MSDTTLGEGVGEKNARPERRAHVHPVSDGGRPKLDVVFDALSQRRRRYVLYYLQNHEPATVEEVAERVVAWERGVPVADVSSEDYDHVVTDLSHSHLPKLADERIIEYDRRSGAIRYRETSSLFDVFFRMAELLEKPD